ncbi:hypothetical protein GWK08_15145 [Leptobacterium flavescens]|uniref:Uncharacterized protein n=1 Tax=Leptobacterium flavescens TaxID=472055 RepID=A0A6P0UN40_9FLAO|nr:hypothetical protein [Leptobacterium flavescens]NER14791.1 hypothetical protein [Leptobacterium flavescens]
MAKKEIFIGFLVGLIANTLGVILCILYLANFTKLTFKTSIIVAYEQGNLGSIIALGAIMNVIAFFLFLRIKRDLRARGVLMATVFAAVGILIYKLM